jgi:predicted ribosome quality control (RQC) complex YloA/Tae2 family protein
MKYIILFTGIMAVCLWGPAVDADIYVWTDEGGIRHFSNRDSHPEAELFLKTMEGPYEEAVERAQEETEKQRELERAEADLQERKERLAEKIAELERRTEAAKQEAQEALERAEAIEAAAARRLSG